MARIPRWRTCEKEVVVGLLGLMGKDGVSMGRSLSCVVLTCL